MRSLVEVDWLVYCNATRETGLGHLARCLGFAEVLLQDGQTVSFLGNYNSFAESMIRAIGAPFDNTSTASNDCIDEIFSGSSFLPKSGLLIDSYTLSIKEFSVIRGLFTDQRIVLLDDFGDRPQYLCDAVINFTIAAETQEYPTSVETFLGPGYYPARSWLREARHERMKTRQGRLPIDINRWLLVCGGTDFCQVTYRMVDTLATCLPNAELRVLLANGVDTLKLEQKLQSFSRYEIIQPTPELKEAFVWADACICGGGLTKYECLFSGIPVASFAQTPGQQADTDVLVQRGLIADLGPAYDSCDDLPIKTFSSCFNDQSDFTHSGDCGQSIVGADDVKAVLLPFFKKSI